METLEATKPKQSETSDPQEAKDETPINEPAAEQQEKDDETPVEVQEDQPRIEVTEEPNGADKPDQVGGEEAQSTLPQQEEVKDNDKQEVEKVEPRPQNPLDEAKEELFIVNADDVAGGSAYDFGKIVHVPTQDTVPFVTTFSGADPYEGEEGLGDTKALLGGDNTSTKQKTPTKLQMQTNNNDDNYVSSISSDSTEALNEKRSRERRCGIALCMIGFLGVVVALVLLIMGFLTDDDTQESTPVPTSPPTSSIPTVPAPPPVLVDPPTTERTNAPTPAPEAPTTTETPTQINQPTSSATTIQPTLTPTLAPTPPFYAFPLPEITVQAIEDSPNSPQAQAYQWMLQDPSLNEYSTVRAQQRFALATLYYATNGDGWEWNGVGSQVAITKQQEQGTSFLSYSHECYWMMPLLTRQEACNDQDQYLAVYLPTNNLQGTLPPEVPLLLSPSTLQMLDLTDNFLTGTIATELATLTQLQTLDLSLNRLTGAIPTEIGRLTQLISFSLYWNVKLGQSLPTELGLLTSLHYLWIFGTMVSGVIPSELGQLSQLEALFLQENRLVGVIPEELFTGSDHNNATAATRQGDLTSSMTISELHLGYNQLTGSIPESVGLLRGSLTKLVLSRNKLTGNIPTNVGQLSLLEDLRLDNNKLSGLVPTQIGGLQMLSTLDLETNVLSGQLPTQIVFASMLKRLLLSYTGLTGELPSEACNIAVLEFTCSDSLCGCDCECSPILPDETIAPTDEPNLRKLRL